MMTSVMSRIKRWRPILLAVGISFLAVFAYVKYWCVDPVEKAVMAIEINRLDENTLDDLVDRLGVDKGMVLYNLGIRAANARNIGKAKHYFFDVVTDESIDDSIRQRAYYNLGNLMVATELPKMAVEMYQEALRLDPKDWGAKYNLEKLYRVYEVLQDEAQPGGEAGLEQEPGEQGQTGRHGSGRPDI